MVKAKQLTFVPFFTDFGFKNSFGNHKLDDFLCHALPLLVGRPGPLKNVERIQNEITAETAAGKGSRLDLLCTDQDGDVYLVEMQLDQQAFFFDRLVFYGCQQFVKQFNRGDGYDKEIPTVYTVGISYSQWREGASWYNYSTLKNQDNETQTEKLVFVTVELNIFDQQVKEPANPLEEFVYMLKHLQDFENMQQLPNFSVMSWMKGAFKELQMANLDPEQRTMVEADIIWLRDKLTTDERNRAHYLRQGKAEGLQEGEARGLEKGKAEERAKAYQEKLAMAKALKALGDTVEKIAKVTQLPIEVIERL